MSAYLSRFSILAWALAVAACGSSAPAATPLTPEPAPAIAAEPATPVVAATPPVAPVEPALPPPPPAPALTDTAADRLGTAPTGLGLKVGAKAPDATLPGIDGKPQKLAALYKQGPTFVVFYRGGWCPFCNLQLHGLTAAKPEFDAKGIKLVAISVDSPGEAAKTQAKQGVAFPMLSDPKLVAHKAFHVVHVPGEAEAKALAGFGVDLEAYSGENHHSFAVPAIFLVDKVGKVRWQHVDEDYKARPSPAQLLEVASRTLAK
jgi:peroxiredoxin